MTAFGISLIEPTDEPIFNIHRFKVFNRGKHHLLEPGAQKHNLNYQIDGTIDEKIVVRIFFRENQKVYRALYYVMKGMDKELALLLSQALVERLKVRFKFSKDFQLKEIENG